MELGTLLLMLGLAYAFGLLWYDLVPGRLPEQVWRVAAYPFLGIFVLETFLPSLVPADPTFGGIHLFSAAIGSLVAVLGDWVITAVRHPALVHMPEPIVEAQPSLRPA